MAPSGQGGQSGLVSSHLSHQVNGGLSLSMLKPREIGGPGGATYLPLLVLNHNAYSTQEGISTFVE